MRGALATAALLLLVCGTAALRPTTRVCRRSLLGAAALTSPLGVTLMPTGAHAAAIAQRELPHADLEETLESVGESAYEKISRSDAPAPETSTDDDSGEPTTGTDSVSRLARVREQLSLMLDERVTEQIRRLLKILHWYKHEDVLH